MVKAFIRPLNKTRTFLNFLHHYLVKPPLVYHSDAKAVLPEVRTQESSSPASEPGEGLVNQPISSSAPKEGEVVISQPASSSAPKQRRAQLPRPLSRPKSISSRPKLYQEKPYKVNISALLKRAFIVIFGIDGFDPTTSTIVFADNPTGPRELTHKFQEKSFTTWVLIASFLGLPTRSNQTAAADQEPEISLSALQLLKNMFGGLESVSSEKKTWQFVLFVPFKFPIIFGIKLISIVFNLLLNTVKLFTEWLPQIITSLIAVGFFNLIEKMRVVASQNIHPAQKFFSLLGLGAVALVVSVLNYSSRLLTFILRAVTSPESSAKIAYAAGREFHINGRTQEETESFSKISGFVAASLSISITVVAWTLLLPLVLGTLMTHLPTYLPRVFQTLNTVSQLPIVTKSLAVLNTALSPVANFLLTYTGPALSTMSTFLGVQIPSLALILGTAIAPLAALIMPMVSRLADDLSNTCAGWHGAGNGPVSVFKAWLDQWRHAKENRHINTEVQLLEDPMPQERQRNTANPGSSHDFEFHPISHEFQELVRKANAGDKDAIRAVKSLNMAGAKTNRGDEAALREIEALTPSKTTTTECDSSKKPPASSPGTPPLNPIVSSSSDIEMTNLKK